VLDDSSWSPAIRRAQLQSFFVAARAAAFPRNRRALDVFVPARHTRKVPWSESYEKSVRPVVDEHAVAALAASLDEPEIELPDVTRQFPRSGEGIVGAVAAKVGCLRRASELKYSSYVQHLFPCSSGSRSSFLVVLHTLTVFLSCRLVECFDPEPVTSVDLGSSPLTVKIFGKIPTAPFTKSNSLQDASLTYVPLLDGFIMLPTTDNLWRFLPAGIRRREVLEGKQQLSPRVCQPACGHLAEARALVVLPDGCTLLIRSRSAVELYAV
jgi:hypothetical protein